MPRQLFAETTKMGSISAFSVIETERGTMLQYLPNNNLERNSRVNYTAALGLVGCGECDLYFSNTRFKRTRHCDIKSRFVC